MLIYCQVIFGYRHRGGKSDGSATLPIESKLIPSGQVQIPVDGERDGFSAVPLSLPT